ncbi:MAG: hypothetical protein WCJ33_01890 [Pseudomonadota bacterium]
MSQRKGTFLKRKYFLLFGGIYGFWATLLFVLIWQQSFRQVTCYLGYVTPLYWNIDENQLRKLLVDGYKTSADPICYFPDHLVRPKKENGRFVLDIGPADTKSE